MDKKNGIFAEETPKKLIKKKKEKETTSPVEGVTPRRSSRARHSTGSMDDSSFQELDELEEKRKQVYKGKGREERERGKGDTGSMDDISLQGLMSWKKNLPYKGERIEERRERRTEEQLKKREGRGGEER